MGKKNSFIISLVNYLQKNMKIVQKARGTLGKEWF